jgi:small subunit ribosomal protein S6
MTPTKHLYETTFIVNASLEDTQIEATINHVQEIITRNGGEIKAVNKWGRKRLAYTIQKKNNGFYVNFEFEGLGAIIGQLERTYVLDENILRFLTIQIGTKALKARLVPPVVPALAQEAEPQVKEVAVPEKAPIFNDEADEPKA